MKKSLYSEEQIIGILKQHEGGKTANVCHEHGIRTATLYGWKQKFDSIEVSAALEHNGG